MRRRGRVGMAPTRGYASTERHYWSDGRVTYAAHLSFSLSRRLMREFGTVVQTLVLAVFGMRHNLHPRFSMTY